jgi:hypothetical protein
LYILKILSKGASNRRRYAIWAILAILVLAGVWLLSVGSFGGDEGNSSPRTLSPLEREAQRLEKQSAANPKDEKLLRATMRAWIEAGQARLTILGTRTRPIPAAIPEDFEAGLEAWNRYLGQTGGRAAAETAEVAGTTSFKLVEIGSTDPSEAEANATQAVRAMGIAARERPNLITLSDLAIYHYFNGELAAGDRAAKRAAATVDKAQAGTVLGQLREYRERAEKFLRRVERGAEELEQSGEERLDRLILAYGSPAGINGPEP